MMTTTMKTSVSIFLSTFLAVTSFPLEILGFSEAVVLTAAPVAIAMAAVAVILGPMPNTNHNPIILPDTNNNRLTRTFCPRRKWKENEM